MRPNNNIYIYKTPHIQSLMLQCVLHSKFFPDLLLLGYLEESLVVQDKTHEFCCLRALGVYCVLTIRSISITYLK